MRKVKLWIGMSFDGFTSGVNEQLDWLVPYVTAPEGMTWPGWSSREPYAR
jgi:hypothetical protein